MNGKHTTTWLLSKTNANGGVAAKSPSMLQLHAASQRLGLSMNQDKTEIIVLGPARFSQSQQCVEKTVKVINMESCPGYIVCCLLRMPFKISHSHLPQK